MAGKSCYQLLLDNCAICAASSLCVIDCSRPKGKSESQARPLHGHLIFHSRCSAAQRSGTWAAGNSDAGAMKVSCSFLFFLLLLLFLLSWAHFPLFIYRQWERQIIITIYKCCCCASLLLVLSLFLSRRNLNSLAVAVAPSERMKFSTGPQVCESEVRGTSWVISCWCSCARTVEKQQKR